MLYRVMLPGESGGALQVIDGLWRGSRAQARQEGQARACGSGKASGACQYWPFSASQPAAAAPAAAAAAEAGAAVACTLLCRRYSPACPAAALFPPCSPAPTLASSARTAAAICGRRTPPGRRSGRCSQPPLQCCSCGTAGSRSWHASQPITHALHSHLPAHTALLSCLVFVCAVGLPGCGRHRH